MYPKKVYYRIVKRGSRQYKVRKQLEIEDKLTELKREIKALEGTGDYEGWNYLKGRIEELEWVLKEKTKNAN